MAALTFSTAKYGGTHQHAAPLMIDPFEQTQVLLASAHEVTVILHRDEDAELLPILRALAQSISHPTFDIHATRILGG
ncbi:MAG: hypothetical protein WCF18_13935 [Chthoniobacteraceae bacterium]